MIPGGGDGSEETITCTVGAYSWPGTIGVQSSVVEGRICLTSAQLPTCGRLRFFLQYFLVLLFIDFPPSQWRKSLKMILCLNPHISEGGRRKGKSAHLHSSSSYYLRIGELYRMMEIIIYLCQSSRCKL